MSRETNRPGMVLYHDKYRALSALDDHDFRLVIDALMRYSETGEQVALEGYLGAIYQLLAAKLDEDIARYERQVEQRREAGRKSARARRAAQSTDADFVERNQRPLNFVERNATKSTNQNQSQSQNQSQNRNQISLPLPPQGQEDGERKIPTVEEIVEYGKEAGYERVDEATARSFIGQQAARGWLDSSGNEIRDWKSWFSGWYTRNVMSSIRPVAQPTSMQYEQRTYTPEELRALTAFMEDEGSDSA